MAFVPDQSNKLSMLDYDYGSASPDFLCHIYFEGLTVQLEYFYHLVYLDNAQSKA